MNRAEKEKALWTDWRDSGFKDKKKFRLLWSGLEPLMQSQVNKWSDAKMPRSAIESEIKNLTMKALPDYNPMMGNQLNTFLLNRLKKVSRYVYKYQNIGKIPEHRITKIDGFNKAKMLLEDKLGREPSGMELSEKLQWPMAEVSRMEAELRASVVTSDLLSTMKIKDLNSADEEHVDFLYYELDPKEKVVYEYLLGKNGKPMLSGEEIAAKMNTSPSWVTRMRKRIEAKSDKYRKAL